MTLKQLRQARGLTQKAVAIAVGVPLTTVQKYESGECKIENMTLAMALRMADALGVTPQDLIELEHSTN